MLIGFPNFGPKLNMLSLTRVALNPHSFTASQLLRLAFLLSILLAAKGTIHSCSSHKIRLQMPLLSGRASEAFLLVLSVVAAQDSVQFFYSPLLDSCEWGASNTFPATNNTENGGLCAYISSTNRLYACPAPDPYDVPVYCSCILLI